MKDLNREETYIANEWINIIYLSNNVKKSGDAWEIARAENWYQEKFKEN